MTRARKSAFTLVEILTVIGIIALLMAVLIPAVQRAQIRAKEAGVKAQIGFISTGLETFKTDYGYYPSSVPQAEDGTNASVYRGVLEDANHPAISQNHIIQGFSRLALALVGRDRLGCPAKRGTGTNPPAATSDQGSDSIAGWYYSTNNGTSPDASFSAEWQAPGTEWVSQNRTSRKGPYIKLEGFDVVNDNVICRNGSTVCPGYVPAILDKFDKGRGDNVTNYAGRSMILYFAANAQGQRITPYGVNIPNNRWNEEIYYAGDNWRITDGPTQPARQGGDNDTFRKFIEDPKAQVVQDHMPRNRETFLLISAGNDGKFFTDDDIKNWED